MGMIIVGFDSVDTTGTTSEVTRIKNKTNNIKFIKYNLKIYFKLSIFNVAYNYVLSYVFTLIKLIYT
jgi:hypothetical protein